MLVAFLPQLRLHERASMLRHTYTAYHVFYDNLGFVAVGMTIGHGSKTCGRWWFQYTSSCTFLTMYSKCVTLVHPFVFAFLSSRPKYSRVKVKCTLVQALRLCTGRTAHRGSRGIALPFHDHGTTRGWGARFTPRPLITLGKDLVPIVHEAGWGPGPVWTGAENLAPTGIRSPDRPARSQSLYRMSYPAHKNIVSLINKGIEIMCDFRLLLRCRWVLGSSVSSKSFLTFRDNLSVSIFKCQENARRKPEEHTPQPERLYRV